MPCSLNLISFDFFLIFPEDKIGGEEETVPWSDDEVEEEET